jgi:hypothetical protein
MLSYRAIADCVGGPDPMIWLYEKDNQSLRIETRYDNRTLQYVLILQKPDGSETERFEKLEDFRQRLLALERSLQSAEWHRSGPPVLDPDGWPNAPPK